MIRRLVLWDVDGTLLRAGDIGAAVFDDAIEAVLGRRPPERVRMSGKTDPLIVREYLVMMGVEETPELVEAVLERLVQGLADAADGGVLDDGAACPGVTEVLDGLAGSAGVVQTLLTGNLYANAVVKVSAYGLDKWLDLDLGAYGSDSDDRNRLVPVALHRLEQARRVRLAPSDAWVVGDTPRDLACARAAGARCLLVATGRYNYDELAGLGADAAVENLLDSDAVVNLLL
ncbi:MAG TPA: haloacid dehalogenase-like hydrolase [Acidimicrobiales bacterium]|nr:haloacid dehalogenase-like hydrolase [Acidimicrobiales bacterium]